MVAGFDGRVKLAIENYGDSELAKRFGVTRYPAIFVDDVLLATPKDFGFYGEGEGEKDGRYAPWRDAKSHERFHNDLERMLRGVLAGAKPAPPGAASAGGAKAIPAPSAAAFDPATLPGFTLSDLDGNPLTSESLRGKVVVVEFWATWCPPCRFTLARLRELKKRYGDRLEVVALAYESDPAAVRRVAMSFTEPFRWAMGTAEVALAFGDLSAVPTLFVFDANGRTREVFYGAPPGLEEKLEAAIARELR